MGKSSGKVGRGTKLEIRAAGTSGTGGWAAIANVTNIGISGRSSEEVDFTTLDSEGGYRELRQGLRDAGSLEFGLHFDPADPTYAGTDLSITKLFNSGDNFEFRVNMKGAGFAYGVKGEGYVMNPGDLTWENSSPISGSATIRISGPLDIVAIA